MIHHSRRFPFTLLLIGVVVTTLSSLVGPVAQAANTPTQAQTQAITLSPASTDVKVDPGGTFSKSVDVINSGPNALNANLYVDPYYVSGENYDPRFTQLPGTVDASKWVKLSLTKSVVKGYKVLTVPYTIQVPKNTVPGGYYAVIFAETSNDNATGVVPRSRVGDILYITVNGTIKSGGDIVANQLPSIVFGGSVPIGAKISNNGGAHFVTTATYSVTDISGKEVFKASLERYVLPQTERNVSTPWSPQSLFGLYTVHRSATIAGTSKSLPDQKFVYINPWLLVATIVLIGIFVGIVFFRARRRRAQRK